MKYAAHHHALALLLGVAACTDPTSVRSAEDVVFKAERAHVVLQNRRAEPIVYMVIDAAFAARANWAVCAAADCPSIRPGESKRIGKHEIVGAGQSDQVIALWWHLVRNSDNELQPDSIRALRIKY